MTLRILGRAKHAEQVLDLRFEDDTGEDGFGVVIPLWQVIQLRQLCVAAIAHLTGPPLAPPVGEDELPKMS